MSQDSRVSNRGTVYMIVSKCKGDAERIVLLSIKHDCLRCRARSSLVRLSRMATDTFIFGSEMSAQVEAAAFATIRTAVPPTNSNSEVKQVLNPTANAFIPRGLFDLGSAEAKSKPSNSGMEARSASISRTARFAVCRNVAGPSR